MASYNELLDLSTDENLNRKIRVAIIVAAETIRTESEATANHTNRLIWAKSVFNNPDQYVLPMIWAVLAQNRAATTATILSASDAVVQSAVDDAVDVFAN